MGAQAGSAQATTHLVRMRIVMPSLPVGPPTVCVVVLYLCGIVVGVHGGRRAQQCSHCLIVVRRVAMCCIEEAGAGREWCAEAAWG